MLLVQTMRIMKRLSKEKLIFLRSDIPLVFMVAMECYSKDTKPEHIMPLLPERQQFIFLVKR
nr:MAG TPA: hypothetical protein [Caudoviricetes sp.]